MVLEIERGREQVEFLLILPPSLLLGTPFVLKNSKHKYTAYSTQYYDIRAHDRAIIEKEATLEHITATRARRGWHLYSSRCSRRYSRAMHLKYPPLNGCMF